MQIEETATNLLGLAEEGADQTLEFVGDAADGDLANLLVRCALCVYICTVSPLVFPRSHAHPPTRGRTKPHQRAFASLAVAAVGAGVGLRSGVGLLPAQGALSMAR